MDGNKSVTAVFTEIPTVVQVQEEPVPQSGEVTEPESEEVVVEEEVPAAPAQLPKTGGIPGVVLYGLGGLISAAGLVLRKKFK